MPRDKISFVEHLIMGDFAAQNPGNVTFTELHALTWRMSTATA